MESSGKRLIYSIKVVPFLSQVKDSNDNSFAYLTISSDDKDFSLFIISIISDSSCYHSFFIIILHILQIAIYHTKFLPIFTTIHYKYNFIKHLLSIKSIFL